MFYYTRIFNDDVQNNETLDRVVFVEICVSWTLIVQWSDLSFADKSWASVVIGCLQEVQII